MRVAVSADELSRMAENAAPDPNRLMPTEMAYRKTKKTVSYMSAVAMLSEHMKNPNHAEKPVEDDSDDSTEGYFVPESKSQKAVTVQQQVQQQVTQKGKGRAVAKGLSMDALRLTVEGVVSDALKPLEQRLELIKRPEEPREEKTERKDILATFKESSHTVTFKMNGMSFSVKCLNMSLDRSTHCLVVCFDSSGESFFTPPVQSELEVEYDGEAVQCRLFYFGMSFSLPELGLRFLGFLCDNGDNGDNGQEKSN